MSARLVVLTSLLVLGFAPQLRAETYAERLGWKPGDRVVIIHIDDAGMSHDSNVGAIRALTEGVANSVSVMMPCPWVPEFVNFVKENPEIDAGLHLTLTAEWDVYRWGPLMGKTATPGLVDREGALWGSVPEVVANASADEVEAEIRAQVDRARTMGFEPTHLDSHMGTLFATDSYLERYIEVGAELGIPIMFPGGHNTALREQYRQDAIEALRRAGRYEEGVEVPVPDNVTRAAAVGEQVWASGLPVLDDLHNTSYGWLPGEGVERTPETMREYKVERYIEALRRLEPGVTMIILHATQPSETFAEISGSGATRLGDMLAMIDPRVRETIAEEGLILTTFRELMERRKAVDKGR